ncbi:MAG: DUF346 domain-containing protein [Flavobacteriales bacterium]|nr:DUF346 domain-containing protein [Flavobacteriales bacterium]
MNGLLVEQYITKCRRRYISFGERWYRGTDNRLHHYWYDNDQWNHGGLLIGQPSRNVGGAISFKWQCFYRDRQDYIIIGMIMSIEPEWLLIEQYITKCRRRHSLLW